MSNRDKNKQNGNSVSEGIKETAGAAFHAVHSALETTENVAMNTVDATAKAVSNMAGSENRNRGNNENQ
ncbi:hypothetical protein [Neobacillus sp. FSL H8-0543]|uniref:hypothetical protein n=1 Tax=Neobacillus sp. FSL H8-0543 TaxID=2954672 RepID=UPI003158ECCC